MHVLVTGGTGFVGVHTVAALLHAGHTVRLLVRSPDKLLPALAPLQLRPEEVETARGDATDAAAVRAAVRGCDAAVHAAAVFAFDARQGARILATNVRAAEVVLQEAVAAGCDPVVHVSSTVAVLPLQRGGRLASDTPPYDGPRAPGEYMRSKAESEQVARRLQAEGAPVVCTYPGAVFGPHDPTLGDNTHRLIWMLRGLFPLLPPGQLWISDVRDVAALHAALLTPGRGPRRYVAPGHALSMREQAQLLGRLTGRHLPALEVTPRVLLPFAKALAAAQRPLGTHYPADAEGAWLCVHSPVVDAASTTQELGLTPRPIEETFADAVRWLHAQGRISRRQAGRLAVQGEAPRRRSRARPPGPRAPLQA
jgi:dihydroflavonol-4-reductase